MESRRYVDKSTFLNEDPMLGTEKEQTKPVEKSSESATIQNEFAIIMAKIKKDIPVNKGEWRELARHAKNAKKTTPKSEHANLDEIIGTANALIG